MSEKQSLSKISEELITLTAINATLGVSGVNHLTDNLADNITKKIVGKGDKSKGIKVSKNKDDLYVIDVYIVADYGYNIPQLAWDIQSAIKEQVQKTINQKIGAVNIHIQGVTLPKKNGR
ncbi:MAG: Asp23/Gls24 family envelope stress response protein [Firmicutes bacterium]|nr:Asp23/Gls24 family envelope stress response protein [Bacillota bacterium]